MRRKCKHRSLDANLDCKACGVHVDLTAKKQKYSVRADAAGIALRTIEGIRFGSMKEAQRYQDLKLRQIAGEIEQLDAQKCNLRYDLTVNGVLICRYEGDFRYFERKPGKWVLEDSKGFRTKEYRIKKRLMLAVHGIEIKES